MNSVPSWQQPGMALFLDIDGNSIPPDRLYMDNSGQMFDTARLTKIYDKWYYNGRALVIDKSGIVLTDYADTAYRDPAAHTDDDSPPTSMRLTTDQSSDEHLPVPGPGMDPRSLSALRLALDDRSIPRMSDLSLTREPATRSVSTFRMPLPSDSDRASLYYSVASTAITTPGLLGKRRFGYDPADLMLSGAIHCTPCRPSNFKYEPKLKVFHERNFVDVPQNVFEVIKPALALAEFIILRGNPRFWIEIACGKREVNNQLSQMQGHRIERLHPTGFPTQQQQNDAFAKLQKVGDHLTYRFVEMDACYGRAAIPSLAFGVTPMSGRLNPGGFWPADEAFITRPYAWGVDPWETPVTIQISSFLYLIAQKIAAQRHPETAAVLRFQFFFAVNICHELSHAFESKCGHGNYYQLVRSIGTILSRNGGPTPSILPRKQEAIYKNYSPPEMGWAFEAETFGGRLQPINGDCSLRYGLGVFHGGGDGRPSVDGWTEIAHGRPYGRAVPMGYIEELLQTSYWDRSPNPSGVKVPEFGAITYLENDTATTSWRQHLNESHDLTMQSLRPESFYEFLDLSVYEDDHEIDRDPKRIRIDPVTPRRGATTSTTRRRLDAPTRRYLQTRLRRYPSRSDAESARIRAELIAEAQKAEAARTQHLLVEQAAQAAARHYIPPPANQPAIDDKFHYIGEKDSSSSKNSRTNPSSPTYDPLAKPASKLTISDKWLLLEEYCFISLGWDSATFLAKRTLNNLYPISDITLLPSDTYLSWGEPQLNHLRHLRAQFPDKSRPARQKLKLDIEAKNKALWTTLAEMEELAAYKGYSRIEFQRSYVHGLPLPEGMTVDTFESGGWRGQLLALRKVNTGIGQGDGLREVLIKGEDGGDDEKGTLVQKNKITNYFGIGDDMVSVGDGNGGGNVMGEHEGELTEADMEGEGKLISL